MAGRGEGRGGEGGGERRGGRRGEERGGEEREERGVEGRSSQLQWCPVSLMTRRKKSGYETRYPA